MSSSNYWAEPVTESDKQRMFTIDRLMHWPQRVLIGLVKLYRLLFKAWLGNACRFEPSCSAYALDALQRHGAGAGAYLVGRRLLRCHPWCDGGHDPVPEQLPRLFSRFHAKTRS